MKKMILLLGVMLSCVAFAGYEQDVLKKMTPIERKLRAEADSEPLGIAVDILDKLDKSWKAEMNKIYNLYSKKVSESERKKLALEQKNVEKKVVNLDKERIESKGFGNGAIIEFLNDTTEIYKNRTLELAKRYDKLNKNNKK